jgi:hypothetical protein
MQRGVKLQIQITPRSWKKDENILRCESRAHVGTSDVKTRRSKIWHYYPFKSFKRRSFPNKDQWGITINLTPLLKNLAENSSNTPPLREKKYFPNIILKETVFRNSVTMCQARSKLSKKTPLPWHSPFHSSLELFHKGWVRQTSPSHFLLL